MSTSWTSARFYGPELLQVADVVSREKGLPREKIFEAMEGGIQKGGRLKYGHDYDIRASIDRVNGDVKICRCLTVVDFVENEYTQITLEDAVKTKPDAVIGDVLYEELPPMDLGRAAAQVARQAISQKIYDAERQKQYEEFKDRIGEIVNGTVKRAEYNSVTLDLGHTEAVIKKDQLIPRENFRVGDRVRAYIVDVSRQERGPQIFLSRVHPQFMAKLFMQEVPEIYDGLIEVKSVARDPGSRAKLAVYSSDHSIDPIGACVGIRGNRVQAIINELRGEKIDIVLWSDNSATFAVNALAPAEITKVVVDEDTHRFEVCVPDDQLSLAIGRRGQNVRLASQLIGWSINVMGESDAKEKMQKEYHSKASMFMECLDCDEMMAMLLVAEGFNEIEEVAYVDVNELAAIEGLNVEVASELQNRAKVFLEDQELCNFEKMKELRVSDDLSNFKSLESSEIITLAENGINTLDKLADLSCDELMEILTNLSSDKAYEIILKSREHWALQ